MNLSRSDAGGTATSILLTSVFKTRLYAAFFSALFVVLVTEISWHRFADQGRKENIIRLYVGFTAGEDRFYKLPVIIPFDARWLFPGNCHPFR